MQLKILLGQRLHLCIIMERFNGVDNTGSFFQHKASSSSGVRPVIAIKGNTKISSGIGTMDNPYVISN